MEHKKNEGRQVAGPDQGDALGEIAARFQELLNTPRELKRPPGTITVNEYAAQTNTNPKRVAEWFRNLHKESKLDRTKVGSVYYYQIPGDGTAEEK